MIKAIFYSKNEEYFGFKVSGHAAYAPEGKDIVCSAVSALTINTINSISSLCDDYYVKKIDEAGTIRFKVKYPVSRETALLIKSLRIGLCSIYEEYGNDYIRIFFKEV